jgi:ElaB/YqjD/DUF883 family membrane-anchored ribosome-binding protein
MALTAANRLLGGTPAGQPVPPIEQNQRRRVPPQRNQEFEIMAQSQYGGRSDLSDKVSEMKDQATDQLKKVADKAEGLASDAMDQLRNTGAGEVAGNLKGAVDKSVKDQPMATLAMAAAVGFVLGAIWKA